MALADRQPAPRTGGVPCRMCVLLEQVLNEEDKDTLLGWLSNRIPAPTIARELTAEGFPVSESSVKRHRKHS